MISKNWQRIILSLFFCVITSFSPLQAEWQYTEASAIDLTDPNTSVAATPQVAVNSAGNAVAVWSNFITSYTFVQASRYNVQTGTWQVSPDTLSITGSDALAPQIAIDSSGNAMAIWYSTSVALGKVIQVSYYNATSSTWQVTPTTLTTVGAESLAPQIAVDGSGNFFAVWQNIAGNFIQAARYDATSSTWQSTTTLSLTNAFTPQVAADSSGNAIATWFRSNGVNFITQASRYSSGAWQVTPDNLSLTGQNANVPQIAMDSSGNAMVVWYRSNGSNTIIQASKYTVSSNTWQVTPDNLSQTGQSALVPQVTADSSGNFYAVWRRSNGSNQIIQASKYTATSGTWQAIPTDLSQTGFNGTVPQISASPSQGVFAVWLESNGSENIVQASMYDTTTETWQAIPDNLSETGFNARAPQIAADGSGNAFAIWALDNDPLNGLSVIQVARYVAPIIPPIPPTPPTILPPSHLKARLFSNRFANCTMYYYSLRWEASPTSGVVGYKVYRDNKLLKVLTSTQSLKYRDSKVRKDKSYTYSVKAYDSEGNSAAVSVTTN